LVRALQIADGVGVPDQEAPHARPPAEDLDGVAGLRLRPAQLPLVLDEGHVAGLELPLDGKLEVRLHGREGGELFSQRIPATLLLAGSIPEDDLPFVKREDGVDVTFPHELAEEIVHLLRSMSTHVFPLSPTRIADAQTPFEETRARFPRFPGP